MMKGQLAKLLNTVWKLGPLRNHVIFDIDHERKNIVKLISRQEVISRGQKGYHSPDGFLEAMQRHYLCRPCEKLSSWDRAEVS